MSVMAGQFRRAAAFVWDPANKDFVETPLMIV